MIADHPEPPTPIQQPKVPVTKRDTGLLNWVKSNSALPVSIMALFVSIGASYQSHRSADAAEVQAELASRPLLYGNCSLTRSDFLKLSATPDAIMIATENAPNPPIQVQTMLRLIPIVPPYEKALPWLVDRCSIANNGRGTAKGIKFEMKTMFVNAKTHLPTTDKVSQPLSIDFLPPGASYDFIVGSQRDDTALILMPQTVTYQVGLTNESVTEPLTHSTFWNQLTLDNRRKPKNLKPGE